MKKLRLLEFILLAGIGFAWSALIFVMFSFAGWLP